MPITTINGGINAVNKVMLYPKIYMVPTLKITPINTTANDKTVALMDLKNTNNMMAESRSEPIRK